MISTDKEYHKALKALWHEYELAENALSQPALDLLKRNYAAPKHLEQADLLIVGINPAYDGHDLAAPLQYATVRETLDNPHLSEREKGYWKHVWNVVPEAYRERFTYVDLFALRETNQERLTQFRYPSELCFLAKHLLLTQQLIENVIRPKLIVVTDKAAWAYWGFLPEYSWMGYDCKVLREIKKNVILTEVQGLREDEFAIQHAVTPPEEHYARKDALKGTRILFAPYQGDRCPRDQRLTPDEIQQILENDCK